MNNRTIDQIIDANMTVTDHLLRDAIHAVVVDAIYESVEQEREACARICEEMLLDSDPKGRRWQLETIRDCAGAIRGRS